MWLENERVLSKITPRLFTCLETGMKSSPMETDERLDFKSVDGVSLKVNHLK